MEGETEAGWAGAGAVGEVARVKAMAATVKMAVGEVEESSQTRSRIGQDPRGGERLATKGHLTHAPRKIAEFGRRER